MKIAFVFTSRQEVGGGYSYETKCLEILRGLSADLEIVSYFPVPQKVTSRWFIRSTPESRWYRSGFLSKLGVWVRSSLVGLKVASVVGLKYSKLERRFLRDGIDLVYFGAPNFLALGMVDLPMVTTVWDLGHRTKPEYPEFRKNGAFIERDTYFRMTCQRSVCVVVDSERTSMLLQRMYGLESRRVCISGLLPDIDFWALSGAIEVDGTPEERNFILYPAQFWPHKRHIFLMSVFLSLRATHPNLRLVLTGSDQGFLEIVKAEVRRLGLSGSVEFRGFVPMSELRDLYKNASCIAFPSDLGPTNLPPLEALLAGKKIVCSSTAVEGLNDLSGIVSVPDFDIDRWCAAMSNCIADCLPTKEIASEAKSLLLQQQSAFEGELKTRFDLLNSCIT